MEAYSHAMTALPTSKQIRHERSMEKKRIKQQEWEERVQARHLLFGKAKGKSKNLSSKEQKFVLYVEHKAYDHYLDELRYGTNRWNRGAKWHRKLTTTIEDPMPFSQWRLRWYGINLRCYRDKDIPRLAKQKWEEMKNASRDTALPELEGGRVLEVGREAGERERRSMDISVSDLQADSSGEQGRSAESQQLRSSSTAPRGRNRPSETLGA